MKHAVLSLLVALAISTVAPLASSAQDAADTSYESGILAFREQRFADAARHFENAIDRQPENPEAYFLLARIYYETPLKDGKKARRNLETAMELDPDNVQYMVARLLQLRDEPWNFISEKIRESQRRSLALKILKIDSTNAYAHEELGVSFIRDFWRYRNAIMIPNHEIGRSFAPAESFSENAENDPRFQFFDPSVDPVTADELEAYYMNLTSGLSNIAEVNDPMDVFLNDEFDVEKLENQGVPIVDLSQRAQRVYDRAVFHLKQALEANPRHRSVYDNLMQIFALKGENEEALKLLANMYVYFPEDKDLWTYLGYAHYKAGNLEAAAKSFETALAKMPPKMARAYNDLSVLISEKDKSKYRDNPDRFASQFWTSKDPRFLTSYNERKIEHYSRLVYADLLYGAPALDKRGWETERGQILVRYGPPPVELTIFPDANKNVIHNQQTYGGISSSDGGGGGRTLTSNEKFELLNTYSIWDYGEFKFVFEDPFRTGEYRLYSPRADEIAGGALPWQNDYTIIAKETFSETPERYEYEAPGRQIELPYLVNTFKGAEGKADVYVHYGVPVEDFDTSSENIQVTAREGTFVIGDNRDILVEKRRTIYGLRTEQILAFKDANLWVNSQEFEATPGERDISIEFELGSGSTVAVQRRSVDIPDYSGGGLAMSDVLLGYGIEETPNGKPLSAGHVVRRGLSISPAPWSVFALEQPIYLYFEVYGLTPDNTGEREYQVEAILSRKDERSGIARVIGGIFSRGDRGVSLTLPFTTATADDGQYLILDASNQESGLYTLKLEVTDNITGKRVDTSTDLFLE